VFTGAVNGVGTAPTYTGTMVLTLTASGMDVTGSFTGNGGANTFSFSDVSPAATAFSAVGFLNGSALSTDQMNFQNIDVTVSLVPEASAAAAMALATCVGAAVVWVRRRRS
jgi:hypothetical protein